VSQAPGWAPGGGPAAHQAVIINADGGSRGNPGPAGYGAVVFAADGTVLAERAASLGVATNNVAEYSGLIAGLEAARDLGASRVTARMDSKLVVEQMSGRWKIKHPDMKPLANRASALVAVFDLVDFEWVPRAENSYADRLANEAMDAALDGRVWVRAVPEAVDPSPDPRSETAGPEPAPADPVGPDENGDLDTRPTEHDPAAALPPRRIPRRPHDRLRRRRPSGHVPCRWRPPPRQGHPRPDKRQSPSGRAGPAGACRGRCVA